MQRATILSAAAHVLVVAGLLGYAWFKPSRPATAVFELVSAEPARFGPPTPKTPEPPAEVPPEPEPPAPEPEAPALVSKPKDPKTAAKPEPKKPAPSRDSVAKTAPSAPTAPTGSSQKTGDSPVQITNSGDPGLGRWGARVKPLIQQAWNPAKGYDVELPATTIIAFNVSVDEGEISNVRVAQSSGNSQLDEEGVRAVKRRERLIPPRNFVSPGFSEDILQVRYEFIYKGL